MTHTLYHIPLHQSVIIKALYNDPEIKRRLLDLGIMKGATITPILNGRKDAMKAYFIKGSVIAIRKEEAMKIVI